ncbi:MAG: hypothetical protein Q4E35_05945 [Eubacteriales bacterium]|nr:hypothetical protein [Eubacteriales bacterium]
MEKLKKLLDGAKVRAWFLCEIPLLLVLILTAVIDPAQGYEFGGGDFAVYIPVAVLTVAIPMLLNWIKGFLVLYFANVNCSFTESAVRLCRIHCVMALLEALSTLLLFFFRNSGAYQIASQMCLFGHELIYAFLFLIYLREKSEASYKRCTVIAMVCFLASSVWLLLSVIASL